MVVISLRRYSSHTTYTLMIEASMLQIIPGINEGIASRATILYKLLLLVKRQILPHTDSV